MTIMYAQPEDTREIYELMYQTCAAMENPDWYYMDTEEFIFEHISDRSKGIVFKAVEQERIGALFLIHLPGQNQDNIGHDLDFSPEQLEKSAHMESVVVHPDFRGRRLQIRLLEEGEQWLKANGYQHLFATVHPDNRYSLENFQKLGYSIVMTKQKYANLPRHILYKEIVPSQA